MRLGAIRPHRSRSAFMVSGLSALVLWLLWPLLRPAVAPARGATLVVVFDGYHRLDVALAETSGPLLLLSCPLTGQPTPDQRRRAGARPLPGAPPAPPAPSSCRSASAASSWRVWACDGVSPPAHLKGKDRAKFANY